MDIILLDIPEFAAQIGIKVSTVRSWVYQRKIEVVRFGSRVKIPASEIERLIEKGRQPVSN
jgi:excisionase family DNA binding protein